jgi:hypothetical protein
VSSAAPSSSNERQQLPDMAVLFHHAIG